MSALASSVRTAPGQRVPQIEGDAMAWWSRNTDPVEGGSAPNPGAIVASRVIRESRHYSHAVQSLVVRATLVTIGLLLYLWVASVLFGTQAKTASEPTFEVHPLSGATIVGVYAGLGGVVVALQFGARSVIASDAADLRSTARNVVQRNFLRALATAALFASILLGCVSAIWYSRLPHFDVSRVGGTVLASTFLAFVAAETHLLLENPVGEEVRALLQKRRQGQLRHTVQTAFPPALRPATVWLQRVLAFVVVPVLCTLGSNMALPARDNATLFGRLGIIALLTFTAWLMVLLFVQALFDRQASVLIGTVTAGSLLAGELIIAVLQAQVAYHGSDTTFSDLARGLLGMWVCVAVIPFAAMALAARRFKRGTGFIVEDVRHLLARRLQRIGRATERQRSKPPLGRLVIWSWLTVPFFPFGVLLGRRAARDAITFGHRGARAATAAAWTCLMLAAGSILTLVIAACLP